MFSLKRTLTVSSFQNPSWDPETYLFVPPKSVKALYSSLSKLEIEFLDFDTLWGSSTCRIEMLPAQNEWFLTFIVNLLYSRKKKVSVMTLYKWPKFQPFIYGIPELFCSDLFFSCYLSKIFHYGYRELLLTLLTKHLLSRRKVRTVICCRDKTWVLNLTILPWVTYALFDSFLATFFDFLNWF